MKVTDGLERKYSRLPNLQSSPHHADRIKQARRLQAARTADIMYEYNILVGNVTDNIKMDISKIWGCGLHSTRSRQFPAARSSQILTTGFQRQGILEQVNDHPLFKKDLLMRPDGMRTKARFQISEQLRWNMIAIITNVYKQVNYDTISSV